MKKRIQIDVLFYLLIMAIVGFGALVVRLTKKSVNA